MDQEVFIIYADILLLINFVLDFLCLFISGRLLSKSFRAFRILAASLFGAAYTLVNYALYPLAWYFLLPLHLAAACLICLIAFKVNSLKDTLKTVAVFIFTSALLGGLLNAVYGISGRFADGVYTEIGAAGLLIISVLSTLIAISYSLLCKKRAVIKSMRADIYINGEPVKVNLLVDSGNMATEPFTSLPVIIISSVIMPPPLDNPAIESSPIPLRLIPIKTGAGNGLLFGFIPKKVVLRPFFQKERVVEAAVAIDTKTPGFATYDGLLPYSLTV
ncbi:MAG: hypothetical protein CVU97_04680 [Firmicutes bacterium HGW-Firmicutes-21]|nr:MAG: hypothetical protein CVU97_04680 [Firmicutes bacterium HGW-Firmicutes-21]